MDDYIAARLEWRDGELIFVDPDNSGWRPRLVPTDDPDVFVVGPGCAQSGEQARFLRLPDGRVTSVLLASGTLHRLAPVAAVDDAASPADNYLSTLTPSSSYAPEGPVDRV